MGLVLGIALFIFLPAFAWDVLVGEHETGLRLPGISLTALCVWLCLDDFHVRLIGRMKDIKRMFSYHGAEHKTIHCYEHGLELTPENARSFPRLHVRCGTAFLIMVMIIAILVYTIIPLNLLIEGWGISGLAAFALLIVVRIALMPLIAGISYEDDGEVGRQPSGKSAGARGAAARHADAAPCHQRAQRFSCWNAPSKPCVWW